MKVIKYLKSSIDLMKNLSDRSECMSLKGAEACDEVDLEWV